MGPAFFGQYTAACSPDRDGSRVIFVQWLSIGGREVPKNLMMSRKKLNGDERSISFKAASTLEFSAGILSYRSVSVVLQVYNVSCEKAEVSDWRKPSSHHTGNLKEEGTT